MFKLITTLCLVIVTISSIECAKPAQARQINVLDDSKFPHGVKIGFSCRKTQSPMSRSSRKEITMTSLSILKYQQIVISGEMAFELSCSRDVAVDKGQVVPPEEVEKEVKEEGITESIELLDQTREVSRNVTQEESSAEHSSETHSEPTSEETTEASTEHSAEHAEASTEVSTENSSEPSPEGGATEVSTEAGGETTTAAECIAPHSRKIGKAGQ